MGTTLGKPFSGLLYQENETRILFFGLGNAGKSSIRHKLITGEILTTNIPTIGLAAQRVEYKNSSFIFLELGGQYQYELDSFWKRNYHGISGLVYVVDSTDREQIEEAKRLLYMVMDTIEGNELENVDVLVYGNKCEVPEAMSASEISNELDLVSLRRRNWQRNWHFQSSCALSGDGLHEGFDWLLKNIQRMSPREVCPHCSTSVCSYRG